MSLSHPNQFFSADESAQATQGVELDSSSESDFESCSDDDFERRERFACNKSRIVDSSGNSVDEAPRPSNAVERALGDFPSVRPNFRSATSPAVERYHLRRLVGSRRKSNIGARGDRSRYNSDETVVDLEVEEGTPLVGGAAAILRAISKEQAPQIAEGQDDALPTGNDTSAMSSSARRTLASSPLLRRVTYTSNEVKSPVTSLDSLPAPHTLLDLAKIDTSDTLPPCPKVECYHGDHEDSEASAYPGSTTKGHTFDANEGRSLTPTAPTGPNNSAKRPARFAPVAI